MTGKKNEITLKPSIKWSNYFQRKFNKIPKIKDTNTGRGKKRDIGT